MWYTENSNVAQSENADCLTAKDRELSDHEILRQSLQSQFLTIILSSGFVVPMCCFLGLGRIMMRSGGQTTYDEVCGPTA